MFNVSVRLLTLVTLISVLSACGFIDARLEQEFAEMRRGPQNAPYYSVTSFSHALVCMDNLMLKQKIEPIPIMIEDIEDKTEAVHVGVRDMLVSAISEMTQRSKGIRLVLYGKDSGNLISFMKAANNDTIYQQMPLYDIQGSISQFDKALVATDGSTGLFARRDGGIGIAHSTSLSVLALDLNVISTHDMSIVPGVFSKNSVAILQKGDSLDADAAINKFGVYFDLNLSRNEGQAQAVRSLVELGAVELVGKLLNLPYEQCVKNNR